MTMARFNHDSRLKSDLIYQPISKSQFLNGFNRLGAPRPTIKINTSKSFFKRRRKLSKIIYSVSMYNVYVTGKMDVLGKTVLPRQNGFA